MPSIQFSPMLTSSIVASSGDPPNDRPNDNHQLVKGHYTPRMLLTTQKRRDQSKNSSDKKIAMVLAAKNKLNAELPTEKQIQQLDSRDRDMRNREIQLLEAAREMIRNQREEIQLLRDLVGGVPETMEDTTEAEEDDNNKSD